MNIKFLAIQLIGLIPSVIAFTSLQTDNRKRIVALQFFCGIMWGTHYALLGAYTAVLTNVIALVRAVLCYYNDKPWANKKGWVVFLIAMYVASAAFTWDGIYCILPCIAMTLTTLGLWTHNMRHTRLLFLCNSPFLLLYNVLAGSYSCAIIETCALISFIIAVYRFDIRGRKDSEAVSI